MNWDPLAFERWEQVVVVALLLLFFAYQTSEVRRSRIAAERAQHGNHKLSKGTSRILTLQEQQQQHIELVKQTLTTSNSGSHILDKINQITDCTLLLRKFSQGLQSFPYKAVMHRSDGHVLLPQIA